MIEDFSSGRESAFDHLIQEAARDADLFCKAGLCAGFDNGAETGDHLVLGEVVTHRPVLHRKPWLRHLSIPAY